MWQKCLSTWFRVQGEKKGESTGIFMEDQRKQGLPPQQLWRTQSLAFHEDRVTRVSMGGGKCNMSSPEKQGKSLLRSHSFHPRQHQLTEKSTGLVMKGKWEGGGDLIPIWSSFFPSFRGKDQEVLGKKLSMYRHSDIWSSGFGPRTFSQAALDPNCSSNTHWLCDPANL